MSQTVEGIKAFLREHPASVLIKITNTKGSTPREKGAWMMVSDCAIYGTIGGGELEWQAINMARSKVTRGGHDNQESFKLGPEIGQCCGGYVELEYHFIDQALESSLIDGVAAKKEQQSHVYLFGAGHVGRAIATALSPLPLTLFLIDQRDAELALVRSAARQVCAAIPEEWVWNAPPGSVFLIATHDHGLDFLIADAALKRGDAAYVGMIGSKTKKNRFRSLFLGEDGTELQFEKLNCPMGANTSKSKLPSVIAANISAEIAKILL